MIACNYLMLSCSKDEAPSVVEINNWSYLSTQQVIGSHRGLLGYPENTYESIVAAIEAGYKVVEIDVARTKDGVFVVHHDETIDRCSNGSGNVKDFTFEELQDFNFGHYLEDFQNVKLRTLDEILVLCKSRDIAIELDLSNNAIILDEYVKPIYELVKKRGLISKTLFCGNVNKCTILQGLDQNTNMSLTIWSKNDINSVMKIGNGIMYVTIPKKELTKEVVDIAHKKDLLLEVWTCISTDEVNDYISMGADYILEESNSYWWN